MKMGTTLSPLHYDEAPITRSIPEECDCLRFYAMPHGRQVIEIVRDSHRADPSYGSKRCPDSEIDGAYGDCYLKNRQRLFAQRSASGLVASSMLRADIAIAPVRNEDTDEIVALYDRANVTEPGIGPVPRIAWQRFVKQPQNHGGRDFRVVRHDGCLVGLAESHVKDQGEQVVRFLKVVVDPAYRRRRIATMLLVDLLKIDQPVGNRLFQCLASSSWTAGLGFLRKFGFVHIESEIGMGCAQLMPPREDLPSAVSLERVANPADHAANVACIHNAAYRNDVAFRPFTTDEMAQALAGDELWIAREGARVIAFCHLELEPKLAWLESIAVAPDCQSSGLGTALAYRALEAANVGVDRPAGLNVSSNNPRAISVYGRLGFVSRRETRRFSVPQNDLVAAVALNNKLCKE
jgi:ribosomal protein S18 acetylase RimI-like enzyme